MTRGDHNLALKHEATDLGAHLDLVLIERELGRRSMRDFIRLSWNILQPGQGIRDVHNHNRYWPITGWAFDAVCDHVEAWTFGDIKRLIINIPPRFSKSTIGSQGAPVFGWIQDRAEAEAAGRDAGPHLQYLTCSYRGDLSTRDAVRSRRLIEHPWFQERWGWDTITPANKRAGNGFQLTSDQNAKMRYENNRGGHRISQSPTGGSTGEGGDRVIADDPHNVKRAESDVERASTIAWWDEEMSTRLNDILASGLLIIMQRLHHQDLTGSVLSGEALEIPYEHLMLPAEYDGRKKWVDLGDGEMSLKKRKKKEPMTSLGFEDPRTKIGESIEPTRLSPKALKDVKGRLGAYAAAGQLGQTPTPRHGGMFEVDEFITVPVAPISLGRKVRYWDKAGTDKRKAAGASSAQTAGVLLAEVGSGDHVGKWIILDSVTGQWEAPKRERKMHETAVMDREIYGKVLQKFEQEPGSGGKESAQNTTRKTFAGFNSKNHLPTGDKAVRAEPYSAQQSGANILLLRGPWNASFKKEHENYPHGGRKDQVDGASGGFNELNSKRVMSPTW